MVAEPLTPEELMELRADLAAVLDVATEPVLVGAFEKVDRLLATLDAERNRYIGVLYDLHKAGIVTVDRRLFGRWMSGHAYDEEGRFAYTALGSLTPAEAEAQLQANPEYGEEMREHARRLVSELDERKRQA